MLTPAYRLTIGKQAIDTVHEPFGSTVVNLCVKLDMETPADVFVLVLGQIAGLAPARDDAAKVELGYADNNEMMQVMAGKVTDVEPNLKTKRVIGYTAAEVLLRSFLDETYQGRTAGAIVRDLAGKAKVGIANVEDGIGFPAYVIDGRRSFYLHMRDLAELCGFDLYFNSEDKLVFEKFIKGKAVHSFQYAKHILEADIQNTPPLAGTVEAWGESPTGSKGADAWAWLTKNFSSSKGDSGSGKPKLLLERVALRTKAAAQTAAAADATRIRRRTLRGRLLSLGRPEVKLGDAIQIQGSPDSLMNKQFQVRSVIHRMTKPRGFTTEIGFCAI
jgi:phage protein D